MSIDSFVSKIGRGARSNLFEVEIDGIDVSFLGKGAQLPGRTISVVPFKYLNLTIPVAGETTFPEWTVTVMNDESFSARNAFEDWMRAIKHPSRVKSQFPNFKYFRKGRVVALDMDDKPIKTYQLSHLFPTDLGPVDLSWDSQNSIQEYTVTFAYGYWEEM